MTFQNSAQHLLTRNNSCSFYDAEGKVITSFAHRSENVISIKDTTYQQRRGILLDMFVDGLAGCIDNLLAKDLLGKTYAKGDCNLGALSHMTITTNVQTLGSKSSSAEKTTPSEEESKTLRALSIETLLAHVRKNEGKYEQQIKSIAVVFPEVLRTAATNKAVHPEPKKGALAAAE